MSRTVEALPLSAEEIKTLLEQSPARKFNVSETLVYKGQVPIAGYVLLEGLMTISSSPKNSREIPTNSLICANELLNNIALRETVEVAPGSKAIILDKSSVLEMIESGKAFFLTSVKDVV
ncbi:MAG: hypothetical protein CME64_05235 [Halobacteriovoraceae bacterium]|nr:hypothetical protein [Halobacteriovoraceae bacterium]|tara:strand:- start:294860 stop:295219 length:360 start_codon:yes stop_codon:yes gene_type:complete